MASPPQDNERPASPSRAPRISFSPLPPPARPAATPRQRRRSPPAPSPSLRAQLSSSFKRAVPNSGPISPSLWSTALERTRMAHRSSLPSSPALRGMPPLATKPDLDTVTKALDDFKLEPPALCQGNERAVAEITRYKTTHERRREVCERLLTDAMKARDEGKPEVCRGLCVEIWKDEYAATATRVFACNILAQLASSRGRGDGRVNKECLDWFERADELIKKNLAKDPGLGKVAGAVDVLKQRICGEGTDERVRLTRRDKSF